VFDNLIFFGSILLFVSIYFSKMSYRLGIPTLIIFITIGIISGSGGLDLIDVSNIKVVEAIGILSLTIILFAGGLDTDIKKIRPVAKEGIALSSAGVLLTTIILGTLINFITKFTIWESMLLASIVSSTDAAAVFSILRTRRFLLKKNLGPMLELESGSNDPFAYLLTIVFTTIVLMGTIDTHEIVLLLAQQLIIGVGLGYFFGKFMIIVFNNIKLNIIGLYPVLGLALAFMCFSITSFSNGNGFLAIYISALILGNADFKFKRNVLKFFDGVSWLMQLVVFLTMGLMVIPKDLISLSYTGILLSICLMLIARPLTVFIIMSFFKRFGIKEKTLLSWVGLRGAASIVFAMYPLIKGVSVAQEIFNLVFFMATLTVLIQGTTLNFIAQKLDLVEVDTNDLSSHPLALDDNFVNEILEIDISYNSKILNKKIKDIGFPKQSLIIRIERDGNYISPNGETELLAGDKLLVTVEEYEIYNYIKTVICS